MIVRVTVEREAEGKWHVYRDDVPGSLVRSHQSEAKQLAFEVASGIGTIIEVGGWQDAAGNYDSYEVEVNDG